MVTVGGAKSSERRPPYHHIPPVALRRLAMIFAKGERFDDPAERGKLLGRMNWEEGNEEFWTERYNHALDHLLQSRYARPGEDDLAAVMWYCAVRMAAQEKEKGRSPKATAPQKPQRKRLSRDRKRLKNT